MPDPFLPPGLDESGVPDVPMPAPVPPQMGPIGPSGPMLPPPQRIVSQDPRQQLLTIATLGAMLGAGSRNGIGTGLGHGTIEGQRYMQALTDAHQHTAFQQQEYLQQQQDRMEAERAHRSQQIASVVQKLKEQGSKAQDPEEFAQIARDGHSFLQSLGIQRGPLSTPEGVAQAMGTFIPPEHEKRYVDAWNNWNANPSNKALLEADPQKAMMADVEVNVGTRAKPDRRMAKLNEVAKLAGYGFSEIDGKPVVVPKHAAVGNYQKDKVLVDGKLTDVMFNPTPGAEAHVLGLDGQPIDPSRITAITPKEPDQELADLRKKRLKQEIASNGSGLGGGSLGELSQDGLDYAATQFRVTGVMPALGMGGGANRTKIINTAAEQAKVLKQTPAAAIQKQAAYKADSKALGQMATMGSAAQAYESKANAQVDIINELSPKVPRTNYPLINQAILAGKTEVLGDPNATQLLNAITTFSAEYAKIIEGATGSAAGSSDSARKASAQLVNAAMNPRQLKSVLGLMQREMSLTIQGYDATRAAITERMGGGPQTPAAGRTIRARDPQGVLHEAAPGTPLPAGWKAE